MNKNIQHLLCVLLVCCLGIGLMAGAFADNGGTTTATTTSSDNSVQQSTVIPDPEVKESMLTELMASAAANAGDNAKYTAQKLKTKTVMDRIYEENSLEAIFETHTSITATINCVQADGVCLYSKVMEASTDEDGENYSLRATHTTTLVSSESNTAGQATEPLVCEIEGSSEAGMIVSQWNDGSTEASVFAEGEFDGLFTETYLENAEVVDYTDVAISQDGNVIIVDVTCTYKDSIDEEYTLGTTLEETFFLDATDLHILAMLDDFHSEDGGTLTSYTFTYDEPYDFEEITLLEDVTTAKDVSPLHVVFSAPEYDEYCGQRDYNISLSVPVYVDSQGYYTLFTDPALTQESEIDQITRTGETTVYVVITSYMLQDELQKAAEAAATPSPTPTIAPNTNVTVTKSPTSETVLEGDSCLFIAYADNATAITWQFLNWDGSIAILDINAANYFGGLHISGIGTSVLKLSNIPLNMNGWRVQAIFGGKNGPVYTNTAYLTVQQKPQPTPTPAPTPTPTPAPTSTPEPQKDYEAIARELAENCAWDAASRAAGFGFSSSGVQNFQVNQRGGYATFDVVMVKNYITVTFHFYAWPEGDYTFAVPVGYDAQERLADGTLHYFDMKGFNSTDNETVCWAAFGDALVHLSDYADSYDPTPAPTPEPTAEPVPVVTDEPIPAPTATPEVTPEPIPEPVEEAPAEETSAES